MPSHQTAIIGQSSLDPPLTGCRHCPPWLWLGSNCLPQTKPKNQIANLAPHLADSPNPPFQTDPQTKPKNQTQPQPPYQSQNQRWKKPSVVVFKAKELRFTADCGGGGYWQRNEAVSLDLGFLGARTEKRREREDKYGHRINGGDLWRVAAASKGCSAMANGVCG